MYVLYSKGLRAVFWVKSELLQKAVCLFTFKAAMECGLETMQQSAVWLWSLNTSYPKINLK